MTAIQPQYSLKDSISDFFGGHDQNTPIRLQPAKASPRGYFVFPPQSQAKSRAVLEVSTQENDLPETRPSFDIPVLEETPDTEQQSQQDGAWTKQQEEEAASGRRFEKEEEEAACGEFEWVRSGGILRDAQGRRDKVRTESIRAEIRLQEEERLLMERWDAYEGALRALVSSSTPLHFEDIPWPLDPQDIPYTTKNLSTKTDEIKEFLLGNLKVRSVTVTRKERIRSSYLRWHPDKIAPVFGRVVEEDIEAVRGGISAVIMFLKSFQDK